MARSRRAGWARLALAPALLLAVLWFVDWRLVLRQAGSANPAWLLAGLATAVCANVASAWRWHSLVRWLGGAASLGWAASAYFKGVAINALLPGAVVGGDVYRAAALQGSGLGTFEAGLSVLLDRLSGLAMLVVLGLLAAAWGVGAGAGQPLAQFGLPAVPAAGFLVAGSTLLLLPVLALFLARRLVAAPGAGESRRARLIRLAHRPHTVREWARQVLSSTLVQALSVATLACCGHALGLDLPSWSYAVAAVPTFLMATLPVSFGGWGTREAAAAVSLGAFGVAAPAAVAISMLYGLFALVQAAGGLLLFSWRAPATQARATETG